MTVEEIEELAKPEGFQPFTIVTVDGLQMDVPRPEFIDIPPLHHDEPSYVVVYTTDQAHVPKLVNLRAIERIDRFAGKQKNEEEIRRRKIAETKAWLEANYQKQVAPTGQTVELPAWLWEVIDAKAAQLGVSRNALIAVLLDELLRSEGK